MKRFYTKLNSMLDKQNVEMKDLSHRQGCIFRESKIFPKAKHTQKRVLDDVENDYEFISE